MHNVRHFITDKSDYWGKDGIDPWKKIVVAIIMDGIKPCRKEVLESFASIGVFQDNVMKRAINRKNKTTGETETDKTVAHIFEYTTQRCFTEDLDIIETTNHNQRVPPIQYVLCIKQENAKKINSHRWLFNAFGSVLNPNICVLIDAGTKPGNRAIVHLWRAFRNNENVGGACGEIHAMTGKNFRKLLNPLVAAQNFEYKLSNILDKPLEDTFGFIAVLPGAFSAYKYDALQGRPLEQYFRGDHSLAEKLGAQGLDGMSIFKRNMFLAEDRILCFEITFKAPNPTDGKRKHWHLKYVKASKAETDVPETIDEFISQRRRWLNGSFAATLYSMIHFGQIYRTCHNPLRNVFMHIQLFYNFINVIMTWFSLAAYYLTTTIILELAANPSANITDSDSTAKLAARAIQKGLVYTTSLYIRQTESGSTSDASSDSNNTTTTSSSTVTPFPFKNEKVSLSIALLIRFIYLIMLVISFLLALGNRPKGARAQYTFLFVIFGLIQTYAIIVALFLCFNAFTPTTSTDRDSIYGNAQLLVVIALASTYGIYILSGILYLDPWHLVNSFLQYSFIMPSFTNVVNVYAFCNWHDVTWGTKGADKPDKMHTADVKETGDDSNVVVTYSLLQDDIDREFEKAVARAKLPYPEEKEEKKLDPEDENKVFRTNLIIAWILSNAILAVALTSQSITEIGFSGTTSRSQVYFFILIIITAALAGFRIIGCTIFVTKAAIARGFGKK